MLIVATVTLLAWVAMALVTLYSYRHVFRLEESGESRDGDPPFPRLSVVVAARNEELGAEQALSSLLALDYPDYEVIFVDDRSDDRTGEIADRLSAGDDRLEVVRIEKLPAGWFGKNHACWRGALAASGDVLLFTDGDVVFGRDVVRRGVRHLLRNKLHHVTVLPTFTMRDPMLEACVIVQHWGAHVAGRLWLVRDSGSTASFGCGACNLFRADAYHAIGGHRQVALRPDEDHRLGRLVKATGHRSDVLRAQLGVRYECYRSVRGLIQRNGKKLLRLPGLPDFRRSGADGRIAVDGDCTARAGRRPGCRGRAGRRLVRRFRRDCLGGCHLQRPSLPLPVVDRTAASGGQCGHRLQLVALHDRRTAPGHRLGRSSRADFRAARRPGKAPGTFPPRTGRSRSRAEACPASRSGAEGKPRSTRKSGRISGALKPDETALPHLRATTQASTG